MGVESIEGVKEVSLRKWYLCEDLKETRRWALWVPREEVSEEGMESTKALRQEVPWKFQGKERRSAWLKWSQLGDEPSIRDYTYSKVQNS